MSFVKTFTTEGSLARTLPGDAVLATEDPEQFNGKFCARSHRSGWTIEGELKEDYFVWVNQFTATHPEFGTVCGDFEEKVVASSEEAFQHFMKHHPPHEWDYHDI